MADPTLNIVVTATDRASGTLSTIGDMLGGWGKLVLGVGAGLTAMLAGVSKLAFDTAYAAGRVEQLANVNALMEENAGLAAGSAAAAAAGIKSLGIESVVAQEAVSKLIRGNINLADATTLARTAQDAAVVSGSNSSETFDRIIHGITTLNPLVLRNAGIIVDTKKAYQTYADSLGIAAKTLTTVQKQQALTNAVIEAGIPLAGLYEKALEDPVKKLGSLPRIFAETRVEIGTAFLPTFTNVVDTLYDGAKRILQAVGPDGALRPAIEELAVQFGAVWDQIVIGADKALDAILLFAQGDPLAALQELGLDEASASNIIASADNISGAIRNIADALAELEDKLWLTEFMGELFDNLILLSTTGAATLSGVFAGLIQGITGDWRGGWDTIQRTIDVALVNMVTTASRLMGVALPTEIQKALQNIRDGARVNWEGMFADWIGILRGRISEIAGSFAAAGYSWGQALGGALAKGLFASLPPWLASILTTGGGFGALGFVPGYTSGKQTEKGGDDITVNYTVYTDVNMADSQAAADAVNRLFQTVRE